MMNDQSIISDQVRWIEILAVIVTGLGKFVFMDWLNWRLPYILVACLGWAVYIWYRWRKNRGILAYWGWTWRRFGKTFLELLPIAVVAVIAFVLIGNRLDTNVLNPGIIPILLLYPIWGAVQQFIIVGLIAGNLKDMKGRQLPEWSIVLITALVFAVVHFPFLWLVAGTFVLAIVYTLLYLRGRNLLVLGIYHGWLGAFFFYTVLGRDPWMEVFGQIGF